MRPTYRFSPVLLLGVTLAGLILLAGWQLGQRPLPTQAPADPTLIVGPERCENCHEAEVAQWQTTHHFKTFSGDDEVEAMHRRDHTKEILENLGERSAKRGVCVTCHYTEQQAEGASRARAITGVSCESCHNPAANWVEVHGVFGEEVGGEKASRESESEAHRVQRLVDADAAGMIRTHDLYAIIENCFQCHTVPNERLVNVGGHKAGSEAFNYLEWLNREIKHNYLYSEGAENRAAPRDMDPAPRARRSFVVAELLDVEYSLRGLAAATAPGAYADAMVQRIEAALAALAEAQALVPALSEAVQAVRDAVEGAALAPNQEAALLALADDVKGKTQALLAASQDMDLAPLDALLP